MKGVITSFRRGKHTQYSNQMIVKADKVDSKKDAEKLVGKTVEWQPQNSKKVLKGEVTSAHGGNGAVRVLFETGMPGQSLGTKVEIKS